MRMRYLLSGLAAAALLTSTAFAQTTTQGQSTSQPVAKAEQAAPKLAAPHWRASKMIGLNVYNEQNEKLGDINEIILDKDGKALGYVVGVGGFLGMGEHDILVEPGKLKFVTEPRRTTTSSNTTNRPPAGTTGSTASNTNPPAANAPTTTRNVSNTTGSTGTTRAANEQWYPDHAMMSATKDQLKAMPQFKYSNYN